MFRSPEAVALASLSGCALMFVQRGSSTYAFQYIETHFCFPLRTELVLFIDSSGCSREQPLPGARLCRTPLGKLSVGDAAQSSGTAVSLELLWFVSHPSHPKHSPLSSCSPLLLEWSSPAFQQLSGVTQTCATKTVGLVRTFSDLQKQFEKAFPEVEAA